MRKGHEVSSRWKQVCFHLGTICRWNTNSKPPTVVTKESDMALSVPFLLDRPDFSKTEVVKAYAYNIVAPVMDYWKQTIEVKKGAQLTRMKAVRIFNPLHVLGNKISVSDIDELKIFKFYEHHEIRPQIELRTTLLGFTYVFRTVLTNSPNSCPPECLFSIFNSTYNDDQKRSHTDYIELSIQSQFNKRAL